VSYDAKSVLCINHKTFLSLLHSFLTCDDDDAAMEKVCNSVIPYVDERISLKIDFHIRLFVSFSPFLSLVHKQSSFLKLI
jgi:hypothetical protein